MGACLPSAAQRILCWVALPAATWCWSWLCPLQQKGFGDMWDLSHHQRRGGGDVPPPVWRPAMGTGTGQCLPSELMHCQAGV